MRARLLVAIVAGCSPPLHDVVVVPTVTQPARCDPARWHEAEGSTHRAWLVSAAPSFRHREQRPVEPSANLAAVPLAVVDLDEDDALLADIRPAAVVARWSPRSALGRAVIRESPVSPSAGAPGDPEVRVTAGYRLTAGSQPWVAIAPSDGVSISGWVPRAVSGTIWDEHPLSRPTIRHDDLTIVRAPSDGAPVVGGIEATTPYSIDRVTRLENGWFEVTITTPFATIHGFVHPPPPRPPIVGDDSESELEPPARHEAYAPGTCLRDAPNGTIVGMVRGPLDHPPVHDVGRWYRVVVPTVWGDVELYVDEPPIPGPESVGWNGTWHGGW